MWPSTVTTHMANQFGSAFPSSGMYVATSTVGVACELGVQLVEVLLDRRDDRRRVSRPYLTGTDVVDWCRCDDGSCHDGLRPVTGSVTADLTGTAARIVAGARGPSVAA